MNRRTVLRSIVGAAAFCPTCLSVASAFAGETAATTDHASGPPHWSYGGAEGPEHWGELSPAYRVCDLGV